MFLFFALLQKLPGGFLAVVDVPQLFIVPVEVGNVFCLIFLLTTFNRPYQRLFSQFT